MDFKEQLRKQLAFIRSSCDSYDSGNFDEAIRIATSLRVIFHDTDRSVSLLHRLTSTKIRLLSTGENIPAHARFWPNLTKMKLHPSEGVAVFTPKLESVNSKRLVNRHRWWEVETVYLLKDDSLDLSRKKLVLAAANKDGGAHVDSRLDAKYEIILEGARWKITTHKDGVSTDYPFKYGHLAALRQIGYEVLHSNELTRLAC